MRMISLSEVNKDVKVVDGKLYIGKHLVNGYDGELIGTGYEFLKEDKIAALYVIRKWNGEYWSFITGFDLIGDKLWVGGIFLNCYINQRQVSLSGAYYDKMNSIDYIIENYSELAGEKWAIFEEEDFERYMQERADEISDDCG